MHINKDFISRMLPKAGLYEGEKQIVSNWEKTYPGTMDAIYRRQQRSDCVDSILFGLALAFITGVLIGTTVFGVREHPSGSGLCGLFFALSMACLFIFVRRTNRKGVKPSSEKRVQDLEKLLSILVHLFMTGGVCKLEEEIQFEDFEKMAKEKARKMALEIVTAEQRNMRERDPDRTDLSLTATERIVADSRSSLREFVDLCHAANLMGPGLKSHFSAAKKEFEKANCVHEV